ncbi:MAG: UvrD-helicase domain-containing protein [Opitutales bacterium]
MSSTLQDQEQRDAFIQNIRGSYSVIAPAGVGKTESIIRRIAHLALLPRIDPNFKLSQLVVVTYTKAAASEMQERARQRLVEEGHTADIMAQFNQGFFGTIHSFCDGIAREWGPRMGLRSDFEIETDNEALFVEFMRSEKDLMGLMPEAWRGPFSRLVDVWKVLECLKNPEPLEKVREQIEPGQLPDVDLDSLMNAKLKRASANLDRYKDTIRDWMHQWTEAGEYVGLPAVYKNAQIEVAFGDSFGELFEWVSQAAIYWLLQVDEAFFEYRCKVGRLYFSDTVRVVNRLLADESLSEILYSKNYYVILDEAQDTDPAQFRMLLGMCGVFGLESSNLRVRDANAFARGRWCMVGDFQQSIYKSRADVSLYQKIHESLVDEGLIEGLTFSVTFRCDQSIVSWVNASIEPVFEAVEPENRIDFVALNPRPNASEGRVRKLVIEADEFEGDVDEFEAQKIAQIVVCEGLEGFGVSDWNQVAMLCPRKAQLTALEAALADVGILAQTLSDSRVYRSLPQFAWPVAVLKIISDPEDSFEIASVLRELFGISDEAIYRYVNEAPKLGESLPDSVSVLQIRKRIPLGGEVPDVLNFLVEQRDAFFRKTHVSAVSEFFDELKLLDRLKIALRGESDEKLSQAIERVRLEAIKLFDSLGAWGRVTEVLENVFLQQAVEVDEPKSGHVQLLTCHKSKGLQWDVVILPYLWRGISKPQEAYPSLVGLQKPSKVAFLASSSDPGKSIIRQRDIEAVNELRRLLYVAATRAKKALILVDDAVLFEKKARGLTSFGRLLTTSTRDPFSDLELIQPSEVKASASVVVEAGNDVGGEADLVATPLAFGEYSHLKRVLPSSLGHEVDSSSRELRADDADEQMTRSSAKGAEYGTWWHEFMEVLWASPLNEISQSQDIQRFPIWNACPDQERALAEVSKLLKFSSLMEKSSESAQILCEVPFMWRDPASDQVFDGYVDFVLRDPATGEWFIVDWKTDALDEAEGMNQLAEKYSAQVSIYRKALASIWGVEGKAYLYSTRLGEWIEV